MRLSGLNWRSLATRSVASGEALGNMCCHVRGLSTGSDSSIVAANGDWIAWMSSWLGRPTPAGPQCSRLQLVPQVAAGGAAR